MEEGGGCTASWRVGLEDCKGVQSILCSRDQLTVAVQRSSKLIEFVNRATGNIFVQGSSNSKQEVLGLFFLDFPGYDLAMVTDSGVELYQFGSRRQGLHLRDRFKHTVRWFIYTHATRVVLLGIGATAARVQGYQFANKDIIKLPGFELDAAQRPIAPEELMNPSMNAWSTKRPPLVGKDDVALFTLYNRVFVCHIDIARMTLKFYRVFMDTVMLVRTYDLFSLQVHFSVVDNVVLVHHTQASVVVLYDVAARSMDPIGSPLPIAGELVLADAGNVVGKEGEGEGGELRPRDRSVKAYDNTWEFFLQDVVIDGEGMVYKVQLDLSAVVASYTDPAPLVGFLNRRRKAWPMQRQPKTLLLNVMRELLEKGADAGLLRRVFDTLNHSGSMKHNMDGDETTVAPANILQEPLLSVQEIGQQVFRYVYDKGAIDAGYFELALIEYLDSAECFRLKIPVILYILHVDVLIKLGKVLQLRQLVWSLSEMHSLFIAEHLEELADSGTSMDIRELSLEVYSRSAMSMPSSRDTAACELYCRSLLRQGKVLKALRVARQRNISTLGAESFTEAALKTGDQSLIRCVGRLCTSGLHA
eukprot:evm.model.scf_2036.1 EVM.evm.TU.scf_2036.1   scf_2036:21671-28216(-)